MKLLVTCFGGLDDIMVSLPFIKGLQDLFPHSEITLASYSKFSKIPRVAPYIHQFIADESSTDFYKKESMLFEYDQIIDIDKLLTGALDSDLAKFLKSDISHFLSINYLHKIEVLMRYIPENIRRLNFHLQESVRGYEKAKEIFNEEYDIVIYPFEKSKTTITSVYNLKFFLSYFSQMNPGKKILLIGFKHQQEALDAVIAETQSEKVVASAIVDIESALSLIKKAKYFIVGDSPIKYLACQSAVTVFDLHQDFDAIRTKGVYKEGSYCLSLNEKPLQKIVYSSDEFVFENNAHFLSYFVTSVIDNDFEKILLLTEGYQFNSKVYKSSLHPHFGWRCVPVFWDKSSFKEFLAYNALKYSHFEQIPEIFENVYDHAMEDSDYSFERAFYETSDYLNQIIHVREIMTNDSTFGIFLKLQDLEDNKNYNQIVRIMAEYLNFDIHEERSTLKIEELQKRLPRVRAGLKDIQRFLNQFKIYASQKILESFDSVSDLRI